MNRLKALETVAEAAEILAHGAGVIRGRTPEDEDTYTHELGHIRELFAALAALNALPADPAPAEVERLKVALERIANHPEANVVLTDYGPDGKQRVWPTVEQEARAALAKEPGDEG